MTFFGMPVMPSLPSLPTFGLGKKAAPRKPVSARARAAAEAALAQLSMGPPTGLSPVYNPQPKPEKTRSLKDKKPHRPSPYRTWSWPLASLWRKEQQHLGDWQDFNVNYAALHSVKGEPETYDNHEGWTEVDWNDNAWLEKEMMKFDVGKMTRHVMSMNAGEEVFDDMDEERLELDYGYSRGSAGRCGRWS